MLLLLPALVKGQGKEMELFQKGKTEGKRAEKAGLHSQKDSTKKKYLK